VTPITAARDPTGRTSLLRPLKRTSQSADATCRAPEAGMSNMNDEAPTRLSAFVSAGMQTSESLWRLRRVRNARAYKSTR